jgi:hypothetical protein
MALRKKEKYIFNTQTLSYEKAVVGWGTRILRFLGFMIAAFVFSSIRPKRKFSRPR